MNDPSADPPENSSGGSDSPREPRRFTSPGRRRWRRFQATAPAALALLGGLMLLLRWLQNR